MTVLRALFLVSEMAPLTGTSQRAKEHHFLSRAVAELGADVVVAVPGWQVPASARRGLARRLTPLRLVTDNAADSVELTVLEGSAASGRVDLLVIDVPAELTGERALALFYRAALVVTGVQPDEGNAEHEQAPVDVVFASHGTLGALATVTGLSETDNPVRIFLLGDPEAEGVEFALDHADRVVVSSAHLARTLVGNIDSGGRDSVSRRLARYRDLLRGVSAGIDTVEWNPRQDGLLDRDFMNDPRAGKAAHKQRLRDQLHLRASNPNIPLVALIGPIDDNVLTYGIANRLAQMPLQLVVVADPEADAASLRYFNRLANQGPDRIAVRTFDDGDRRRAFVHDLVASADFFLIPRDASPLWVSDLYGMAYGCAPIAPNVGGYADMLVEFDGISGTGSGFLFRPYESDHLLDAVQRALNAYRRQKQFGHLVERVMSLDLSWRAAAQRHINVVVDVLRERSRVDALAS